MTAFRWEVPMSEATENGQCGAEFDPPEWLVDAVVDAFLGGDWPEHMTRELVIASGILQAMHSLGVRFARADGSSR